MISIKLQSGLLSGWFSHANISLTYIALGFEENSSQFLRHGHKIDRVYLEFAFYLHGQPGEKARHLTINYM